MASRMSALDDGEVDERAGVGDDEVDHGSKIGSSTARYRRKVGRHTRGQAPGPDGVQSLVGEVGSLPDHEPAPGHGR
jgi:hypothetical protein